MLKYMELFLVFACEKLIGKVCVIINNKYYMMNMVIVRYIYGDQ
jgi:hypothetical protein